MEDVQAHAYFFVNLLHKNTNTTRDVIVNVDKITIAIVPSHLHEVNFYIIHLFIR